MNRSAVLVDANTVGTADPLAPSSSASSSTTTTRTTRTLLRDSKNSHNSSANNNNNSSSSSSSSKRLGLLGSPLKLGKRRSGGSAPGAADPPRPLPEAAVRRAAESPSATVTSAPSKSSAKGPSATTTSKRHPNAYEALQDDPEDDDDTDRPGDAEAAQQQRREIFRGLEGGASDDAAPSSSASAWTAVPAAPAVAPPRRSRQYFSKLPTLDETSSSESDAGFEDDDRDNAAMLATAVGNAFQPAAEGNSAAPGAPSPPRKSLELRSKPPLPTNGSALVPVSAAIAGSGTSTPSSSAPSSSSADAANATNKRRSGGRTFQDRVRELTERGDDLAARGKEEEALAVYKKALKVNRVETSRIKSQLKQVDGKHPSTVHSIASRLYEDWLEVGTSIAHVRSKMAVLAERVGDYDRALACCAEAKGVYKRQWAFLDRKKLDSVAVQARAKAASRLHDQMARAQRSFARRKQLHEEIVKLRRALLFEPAPGQTRIRARLEELAQRALALETDMLGRDHPQVADTLSVLATLAAESDRLPEAVEYLREASLIAQSALGSRHPLTGELLLQLARAKASQSQVDVPGTLQDYRDALAVFREVTPSLVTPALNEMSVLHIRQKEYAVAVDLLNEALEASAAAGGGGSSSAVPLYRNLGECYSHMRDYPKAVEAFAHALERQREIRGQHQGQQPPPSPAREDAAASSSSLPPPPPLGDDDALADTVRRLGKAYMGCGRPADALNMYGEALLIHRAAVLRAVQPSGGRPHDYGLPERQDQLANTLFCIAEAREALGDTSEAERVYSESMQLRLFSDAHRADKRQNMIHCAMCLRGIGNVHMSRREYEAAQRVFEDAVRYCEGHGLPDEHPISSSIRQKLQEATARCNHESRVQELHRLEQEAKVQIAAGDLDQAVDTLTRLMSTRKAILKLLKESHRDATNEKVETAYTLKLFGKVLLKKGDAANAERALGDALKLFKKGDEKDRAAVEEVRRLLDGLRQMPAAD